MKTSSQGGLDKILQRQNESNIKLQLMKKDKALLSYSKSLSDSKTQIENLQRCIDSKDQDILQLKETIQELSNKIDNNESMTKYQSDQINQYRQYYDLQLNNNNEKLRNQIEKYNEVVICLKNTESKLNDCLTKNEKITIELEEKIKELKEKDDNINYLQLIINNLKNENKEINILYNKNVEYQKNIQNYENEIKNYKEIINKMKSEMNEQNDKINEMSSKFSSKEQNFSKQIFLLQNEINSYSKNYQLKNDDFDIMKEAYEKLNKETEQYTIFITNKSNELSEYIDNVIESTYVIENVLNEEHLKKKNTYTNIKFEIIDDGFLKLKKKILEFVKLQKALQNKLIKQIDDSNKINENFEVENKNLQNTNMTLFKKNEELTNKLNEQTANVENFNQNYLHLKELYSKLYSDYELFTEKNEKFVNDTQKFYTKMIGKFENLIKIEDNNDHKKEEEKSSKDLLKACITTIIEKYKTILEEIKDLKENNSQLSNETSKKEKKYTDEIKSLKEQITSLNNKYENDTKKQKDITLEKIKQITNLLDESKKIIAHYEEENKELKNENEKYNYRYKMLLLSHNSTLPTEPSAY